MVFLGAEDFYEKANACKVMNRQEEIACARRMQDGDAEAREELIRNYLPMVAGHIRHLPEHMQTFGLILCCQQALEKAVDRFDFLQESETFAHRLSWWLRQTVTSYIVR